MARKKARYRLTSGRLRSIRKAQRVSARKRKGLRAHDTVGYWVRKGIKAGANKATLNTAGTVNTWVEGNYRKRGSRWLKDRSKVRRRKRR